MDEPSRQNSPASISLSMDSDEKDIDENARKDRNLGRKIVIGYLVSCLISVPTVCFLTYMLTPPSPILQVQLDGFASDDCMAGAMSATVLSTTKRKKAVCHNWMESLGSFQYKVTGESATMHKDGDYGICTLKAFERAECAGKPVLEVPILLEHSSDWCYRAPWSTVTGSINATNLITNRSGGELQDGSRFGGVDKLGAENEVS